MRTHGCMRVQLHTRYTARVFSCTHVHSCRLQQLQQNAYQSMTLTWMQSFQGLDVT